MTVTRRVIFSADDFGLSAGVNAGILRAHREGVLTNASLMVNAAAFEEAVALSRSTPTLSVGLHLVLVQGRATLPPGEIPLLVGSDGMFGDGPVAAGLGYFFTPAVRAQLEREVRAQIEKFLATGLPISHVDGHLNIHMHPTVLAILTRIAPEYGLRALRLPREPVAVSLRADPRSAARKGLEAAIFSALGRYAAPRLAAAGLRHTDQIFGLHNSGHITEAFLLRVLSGLPPGVTEIYTHASRVDDEARRWRPSDYECEAELAALTAGSVREALQRLGIALTSYRELARA